MKLNQLVLLLSTLAFSVEAHAVNPYAKPNDAWIVLGGTVESVNPNSFQLNYGEGTVTVEMDDGDRDADAYKLLVGDKVNVAGKIDRDLFEKTKIEAGSVYVESIGTTFLSSAKDEEDAGSVYQYPLAEVGPASAIVYGTVAKVSGRDLLLKTGDTNLTVETAKMAFNPVDNRGYLKIKKGDYISASGKLTEGSLGNRKLQATKIVKYYEGSSGSGKK